MSTRTIHWFESSYDLGKIDENHWQFQIAKLVATAPGSPPVSNIVWKSMALQPKADITWPVVYGLNWSATLPTEGITVSVGGDWQECDKGQAYDLTNLGEWTPSTTSSGTAGWMTVGTVNYKYPNVAGIHIIVGVQNPATGAYDPIFIDPTELPPGSSGSYQPQEEVRWWLEGSNLTGSVYSKTRGSVGGVDLSDPAPTTNKYEYWTTYLFDSGSWANTQTAPLKSYLAPPPYFAPGAVNPGDSDLPDGPPTIEFIPWPWLGVATFTAALTAARQKTASADIKARLSDKYTGVTLNWVGTNGVKLHFSLGTPKKAQPGSLAALGFQVGDDPTNDVSAALTACKADFPDNETWTIGST